MLRSNDPREIEKRLRLTPTYPLRLMSVVKTELPDPAEWANALIYVSNEAGGPMPAFSDGTNWRRITDGAVVS